jgi:hypothetical protein
VYVCVSLSLSLLPTRLWLLFDPAQQEASRRREIEKKSYHIRVVVNEQVLGRTASHSLDVVFNLQIAEAVKVRLHKWPDSVKIELWESVSIRSHMLTYIVDMKCV